MISRVWTTLHTKLLVGPMARPAPDLAKHVRQHVQRRQLGLSKPPRIYPQLSQAVAARCQTARNFPGHQYLSEAAATEMVLRGTRPVDNNNKDVNGGGGGNNSTSASGGGVVGLSFVHDPRLLWPSVQFCTDEQVEGLYDDIQCPTAILLSVDGWPFDPERHQRALDRLKPVVHKTLPGSHHFHADPDTVEAVVEEVAAFLCSSP
jgi:hypothetical protein